MESLDFTILLQQFSHLALDVLGFSHPARVCGTCLVPFDEIFDRPVVLRLLSVPGLFELLDLRDEERVGSLGVLHSCLCFANQFTDLLVCYRNFALIDIAELFVEPRNLVLGQPHTLVVSVVEKLMSFLLLILDQFLDDHIDPRLAFILLFVDSFLLLLWVEVLEARVQVVLRHLTVQADLEPAVDHRLPSLMLASLLSTIDRRHFVSLVRFLAFHLFANPPL